MERICDLCGSILQLDKVFKGKAGGMTKRERWKCPDSSCNHEETIQPKNENRHNRENLEAWENSRDESRRLSKIIEE